MDLNQITMSACSSGCAAEHRRGMPGILEHFHAALPVRRQPDDLPDCRRGSRIFFAGDSKNRNPGRILDVRLAVRIGSARQEHERPDFRMTPGCVDRLIHAAAAADHTEGSVVDGALRGQEAQGGIDIARHPLDDSLTVRGEIRVVSSPAAAEPAEIKRQHVVSRGVQHRGELVVDPAIGVALVQQKNRRSALFYRMEGALQRESVCGLEADVLLLAATDVGRTEQNNHGCQPPCVHRQLARSAFPYDVVLVSVTVDEEAHVGGPHLFPALTAVVDPFVRGQGCTCSPLELS